jgi:phage shock protein C
MRKGKDKVLNGVCSGLANHFEVDPIIIRVGFILLSLVGCVFTGILAYFILDYIMEESL